MARLIGNIDATGSLSTTTVTIDTSNTLLYLPLDADTNDDSPEAQSITNSGVTISSTQNKFGGYSGYFDGSSFLQVAYDASLGGTAWMHGDYTLEAWLYPTDASSEKTIFSRWDANASYRQFVLKMNTNRTLTWEMRNVGNYTTSNTITLNAWSHVAVSESNGVVRCFINGVQGFQQTVGNANSVNRYIDIGRREPGGETRYFVGYMDDVRFLSSGIYTAAFTPVSSSYGAGVETTTNDTRTFSSVWNLNSSEVTEAFKAGTWPTMINTQYTVLSLALDTDFTDISSSNHSMTANGNTQISTAQKKFGAGSAFFDGNGDYLSTPASSDFALGSGDFTVSLFYYPISEGPTNGNPHYSRVFNFGNYWNNTDAVVLMDRPQNGNGKFVWNAYSISNSYHMYSTTSVSNGQWYHLQICRSGSTFYLFVNGNLEDTYTSSVAITTSANVAFHLAGAPGGSGAEWSNSYIDDVLVLKGYALNTSSFTAPTAPNQGGF